MQVCDAPILHSLDEKSSRMDLSVEGFIMTIALHKQHCEMNILRATGIYGLLEGSEEAYSPGEWEEGVGV